MTRKLNDVFAEHAGKLIERAGRGLPFTVLISDSDYTGTPKSFKTKAQADAELDRIGLGGAVAQINPNVEDKRNACTLYIRPVNPYGSFDNR